MSKQSPKKHIFTNSVGDEFELYPLNPLEEQLVREQMLTEWKEAGRTLPEKPTYTVTTAAGEVETIRVDTQSEAESVGLAKEWQAYQDADAAFENEYGDRFLVSCFTSLKTNPDDYPQWKMRMKMRKLTVPDDEGDKLILFGKTWVIRSTDDIAGLIVACTRSISTMSDEAAKAAEAKFRLALEGAVARSVAAE